jgi:hypothetical protein
MSDWRLTPQNTALVVVDVQEKLMNLMSRRAETVAGIHKLVSTAKILNIPAIVTLQYVKGLGPLVPELKEATAGMPTFEKLAFSCCGVTDFAGIPTPSITSPANIHVLRITMTPTQVL